MKRIIPLLALPLALHAAKPEDWYTPQSYSPSQTRSALCEIRDSRGNVKAVNFAVEFDEDGVVVGNTLVEALGDINLSINSAIDLIEATMDEAIGNTISIERIDAQFKTLGENLNKIFSIDGMSFEVGGKTYTLNIDRGKLESAIKAGTTVGYSDTDGLFSVADDASLQNVNGVLSIKNWRVPNLGETFWDYSAGEVMMRLSPGSTLGPVCLPYGGIDKLSLGTSPSGKLELDGWSTASSDIMTSLGDALSKEGGIFSEYDVVVRNKNKGMSYVSVGRLKAGQADEKSVTTNSYGGKISLYGWGGEDCVAWTFPRKSNADMLEWVSLAELADDDSISVTSSDENGAPKLEVKGASTYAGKHGSHYFGTSKNAAALGWHELPNVTTNIVEGDNVTIASTTAGNRKTLGLKGWPSGGRDPLFLANIGGALEYLPIYLPTHGAACGCTNKWESLADWIPDTSHDGDHFTPPEADISAYLKTKGFVYGDEGTDLNFSGGKASFNAPENWADEVTITATDGKFALKGFADGSCSADLNNMLTNTTANCEDRGYHQFLCRYTKGGNTLHWLPFPNAPLKTGSGDGWTGSFSYRNGYIQDGCVLIGRTPVRVSGMAATDGEYRIVVDISSNTARLESGSGFSDPQGTISYIPVFVLSDGQITADYRGSFVVQAWE